MANSKTVLSQVEDLQLIFDEIRDESMVLSEAFQVGSVIHLLPPRWKDFNNYLKHKRKEMNLEDLVQRLKIEEGNMKKDGKSLVIGGAKANVVERDKNTKKAKKDKRKLANVVRENNQMEVEISLSAMVTEVNLVGSDPPEWFIDTGATRNLCCNREMFSTFETIEGEKVWMGNSAQLDIAFTVCKLRRYTSNPSDMHWNAITKVMRYLRYIRDMGLHYRDILLYLKGIAMLSGYLILRTPSP
ncbi:PREDICTED: uncharacterized protein LOC109150166 [Ipomoea nil]|uniref:uncharacterized protein LOC109150166 n=1 Tax=Ipomoea nil TaxID=35883 RepID=UPI000900E45D|nr:PREDICTED: uncharacterized protein LOC109150166 [Ipomoea nil]